jgi:crotonobetainyl-CoA:carnitine CoA-transferase CaiB-like acyl-CoA transferase
MSAYFVWLNRGKESAAFDLKVKEDLALLHRLVAKADIFVQNLARGSSPSTSLDMAKTRLTPTCAPTTCWCRPRAASAQ